VVFLYSIVLFRLALAGYTPDAWPGYDPIIVPPVDRTTAALVYGMWAKLCVAAGLIPFFVARNGRAVKACQEQNYRAPAARGKACVDQATVGVATQAAGPRMSLGKRRWRHMSVLLKGAAPGIPAARSPLNEDLALLAIPVSAVARRSLRQAGARGRGGIASQAIVEQNAREWVGGRGCSAAP